MHAYVNKPIPTAYMLVDTLAYYSLYIALHYAYTFTLFCITWHIVPVGGWALGVASGCRCG